MTRDHVETFRPWPALMLGLSVLVGCGGTFDPGPLATTAPAMSSSDTGDGPMSTGAMSSSDTGDGGASTGASTTGAMSAPVLVTLTETDVTLAPGRWRLFAATVENATFPYVTWSLDPPVNGGVFRAQAAPGTVQYEAPATPGTYRLIATSDEDPTVSAAVTITVSASAPPTVMIFDNFNQDSVQSGPDEDTTFIVAETRHITEVHTYHHAVGNNPLGTIALRHSDGTIYGHWPVLALDTALKLKTLWVCYPGVDIKQGTYTVVDSSPATWSMNAQSNYLGFAHVYGLAAP